MTPPASPPPLRVFAPPTIVFPGAAPRARRPALIEVIHHGFFAPGVYLQSFMRHADFAALPPALRPAQATYIPLLDAWQVMALGIAWGDAPAEPGA